MISLCCWVLIALSIMDKKNKITRIIVIGGTVLVWLPIIAPILLSLILLVARGIFRFDYLMPAELFFLILAGGVLLIWGSFRVNLYKKLFVWCFGSAIAGLFISQGMAVMTGLASGITEPTGWPLILVMFFLVGYLISVVVLALAGTRLSKAVLKPRK